jgi:hypothetical protein
MEAPYRAGTGKCQLRPGGFQPGLAARAAGRGRFDFAAPAFVSWLGTTMYLEGNAIEQTLSVTGGFAPGSEVIVDYMLPAGLRDAAGDSYAEQVGQTGPFGDWPVWRLAGLETGRFGDWPVWRLARLETGPFGDWPVWRLAVWRLAVWRLARLETGLRESREVAEIAARHLAGRPAPIQNAGAGGNTDVGQARGSRDQTPPCVFGEDRGAAQDHRA